MPEFKVSLFSVPKATDKGAKVIFTKRSVEIVDPSGAITLRIVRVIYVILLLIMITCRAWLLWLIQLSSTRLICGTIEWDIGI